MKEMIDQYLHETDIVRNKKIQKKIWMFHLVSLKKYTCFLHRITVKPAVAATCIKRDPPVSGHFRAPTILNANAPLLSVHLSNAASGRRNSPPNTEILS